MTRQLPRIPLIGYSDKLSVRPGETIEFKVSSRGDAPFSARLVRSICADPNPDGPGIIEEAVEAHFDGDYPSRTQAFNPGSYGIVDQGPAIDGDGSFTLSALIFPTLPLAGRQAILCAGGASLAIGADGALHGRVGELEVAAGAPLETHQWYAVALTYNAGTGELSVREAPMRRGGEGAQFSTKTPGPVAFDPSLPVTIAADLDDGHACDHFNGKIEGPAIHAAASLDLNALAAQWDFALETPTTRIQDVGPAGLHGRLVNLPARAMTGAAWDGSEMCWRHAPEQYGAIHFHADDIYDFDWQTDFSFTVPDDLPSGIYVARISCGEFEDAMPFFVCPPRGKRTSDLAVLASTFTYSIYGNHDRPDFKPEWKERFTAWNAYPWNPAEYPELGCSTYNYHADGSGICHASHRRPLLNMRPGYVTFGYGVGSALRHFQADSHLIAWLHAVGQDYDIITDQELHTEGAEVLQGYKAVTTGSHPEYHTAETLNALQDYRDNGGNLMYLGGNGFYWRVAIHDTEPGAIEIRRAEGGIRAWAAEPGEYFNAFDGQYGGLWRRNGRPPQMLAGVGFSSQGQFEGSYYRRSADSHAPDLAWVFEGVKDEKIGDFGLSGGGAAGYELDRADFRLGSPKGIRILASSEGHSDTFVLVPEEQLTHITNWAHEPVANLLRADMVYFDVPGGGAVFSTGSITFCGSLPHNNFDNNVSTVMKNVLKRFLGD